MMSLSTSRGLSLFMPGLRCDSGAAAQAHPARARTGRRASRPVAAGSACQHGREISPRARGCDRIRAGALWYGMRIMLALDDAALAGETVACDDNGLASFERIRYRQGPLRHPVQRAYRRRRPDRLRPCLQDGARRYRVEAEGLALSFRPIA